jgi:hypothetical protein
MLNVMRASFGKWVVIGISGFIGFVFVFSGVFTRDPSVHGAVAGSVNGDSIPAAEYYRVLNARMEPLRQQLKLSDEQLAQFGIREAAFDDLVQKKLLIQEAKRRGLMPSQAQIREAIFAIDAFKKDGVFDKRQYEAVLVANNLTVATFERQLREDLVVERWRDYFAHFPRATPAALEREFQLSGTKREIQFVVITPDAMKKAVDVSESDLKKYLADPAKAQLLKERFESDQKMGIYKDQTFESAKKQVARELIASERFDEVKKASETLAQKVVTLWSPAKGTDAKVDAVLKPYGLKWTKSAMITAQDPQIPGLGDTPELMKDAFSAIGLSRPKVYSTPRGVLVAVVSAQESADPKKFTEIEKRKLRSKIASEKASEALQEVMKGLRDRASIKTNPEIFKKS